MGNAPETSAVFFDVFGRIHAKLRFELFPEIFDITDANLESGLVDAVVFL